MQLPFRQIMLLMVLAWRTIGSFGAVGSDSFSPRFCSARSCWFATLFFLQSLLHSTIKKNMMIPKVKNIPISRRCALFQFQLSELKFRSPTLNSHWLFPHYSLLVEKEALMFDLKRRSITWQSCVAWFRCRCKWSIKWYIILIYHTIIIICISYY